MDDRQPLVWLHGEIKTPPLSAAARIEAGLLLRRLQNGEKLSLPHSRAMPALDSSGHELRIRDAAHTWRVMYSIEPDAIVILEVFSKKTSTTPKSVIDACQRRLRLYRNL